MYAIFRHCAAIKAWSWRVNFTRRGKRYSKTFYDLSCGGSKLAKVAAIAWRDAKLAELKALTLIEFHQQKRSNNVSGVPGVHFLKSARQPLGFWQAKIKPHNGKSRTKSFSVLLHGEREAFQLAVAARDELLDKVKDQPFLHNAVAKRLAGKS
jgi:hypothetical protein